MINMVIVIFEIVVIFINTFSLDYLLCHDDQLENRKIAFILYLTENEWSEKDGGQLELFKCDSGK